VLPLAGDYYADCNEVFRKATTQAAEMLREVQEYCRHKQNLSILSVGSGVGLFEVPMINLLIRDGMTIRSFVGVEADEYACNVLRSTLRSEFSSLFTFEVFNQSFQEYSPSSTFDIVLYNHVFEYLGKHHLNWIHKSIDLLSDQGNILIFSPNRGGINKIYAETAKTVNGFDPFFADDIEAMLRSDTIPFFERAIAGECDISLLEEPNEDPDKIRLLSFLTQIDCRFVPDVQKNNYSRYYQSLRCEGGNSIPHPATLFTL
jgi:SAM-dependent methyltransferase